MEMIPTICSKYFRNHSKFDTNISFDISGWASRMFGKRWFQICSGSSWGRFQVIITDEKAWITIPFKFIWFCWQASNISVSMLADFIWTVLEMEYQVETFLGERYSLTWVNEWLYHVHIHELFACVQATCTSMCIFCGVLLEGTRWFDGSGVQNSLKFNNNISEIGGCPYF